MLNFLFKITQTLDVFWKGMVSIFVVVGVIMLLVWIMNKASKK